MAGKAKIDGRLVSKPVITINEFTQKPDTNFTVEGSSPWNSSSKYNVHLQGPADSYYTYKELQSVGKDWEGNDLKQMVTVTGNDPDRIARYRKYTQQLKDSDFWSAWKRFWNEQPNIEVKYDGGSVEENNLKESEKVALLNKQALNQYTSMDSSTIAKLQLLKDDPKFREYIRAYPVGSIQLNVSAMTQNMNDWRKFDLALQELDSAAMLIKRNDFLSVPYKKEKGGRLMRVGGKIIEVPRTLK